MGHFSLAVITNNHPTEENLDEILMPFIFFDGNEVNDYLELQDVTGDFVKSDEHIQAGLSVKDYITQRFNIDNGNYVIKDDKIYQYVNPHGKFEEWEIGGQWENFLTTKENQQVNSCCIRDIDFETLEKQRVIEANSNYDLFEKLLGDKPKKWKAYNEMLDGGEYQNWNDAIKAYSEQESIKQIKAHPKFDEFSMLDLKIDSFMMKRAEYIENQIGLICQCHNVVVASEFMKDNIGWYGGNISIFGVSNQVENWNKKYKELLMEHQDKWITILDCRI